MIIMKQFIEKKQENIGDQILEGMQLCKTEINEKCRLIRIFMGSLSSYS